jgi:hypothetical protein
MDLEIPNAGLVLLFPFLEQYFEACGLMGNKQFTSETSRLMATRSLNHLITNNDRGENNIYLFPKIICGIDIQKDIEDLDPLPEKIKLESVELLTAVIGHWSAIKGTSIESLQEMFLQRWGLLRTEGNKVEIKVGKLAIDVLIESIPWSFMLFQFPWSGLQFNTDW